MTSSGRRWTWNWSKARWSPTPWRICPGWSSGVCTGRSARWPGGLSGDRGRQAPWPDIDPDKALPWVERKIGLALAPGQADAVRVALFSKASVITGGPGVGKTTMVNSILRILSPAMRRTVDLVC